MAFDYSTTGLPDNDQWKNALNICHKWLTENMSMFGPERIASFMEHQPIAAAKLIIANCPDYSDECITLALLGPAKGVFLANQEAVTVAAYMFGERTARLLLASTGGYQTDADMVRDMARLFIVEGLSGMNDQIIGRAKIDKHHQVRWNMLNHYEKIFADVKGQNPGLDKIFEEALVKSRAALEALDKAATQNPLSVKTPKPPTL